MCAIYLYVASDQTGFQFCSCSCLYFCLISDWYYVGAVLFFFHMCTSCTFTVYALQPDAAALRELENLTLDKEVCLLLF